MAWKKVHKASGATVIEHRVRDCRLVVIPVDWTKPKGEARWSMTCGSPGWTNRHKRGYARSVKAAKAAARRALRTGK